MIKRMLKVGGPHPVVHADTSRGEQRTMPTMIGNVTQERYEQLVAEGRELVDIQTRAQFALGDKALEIEPMQPHGGAHPDPSEMLFSVSDVLQMFADDLGIAPATLETHRWVASRWPAAQRRAGVSYTIHRILASIRNEEERFARLANPPFDERTRQRRWTIRAAQKAVDQKFAEIASVQQKVDRIHDLARDERVAAVVATDLLRRPEVAFKAMTDTTARHLVNRAQVDQARQASEVVRERTPALPRIERNRDLLDLIGACMAFVASVGRVLPALRGHAFTPEEKSTMSHSLARVRATADWLETAVDSGDVSLDEGLARLLRGE
ncbi:DUF6192 family protein [Nonomuraea sp. NPDC049152]|uniref:DUF6192 family protein n=1 Tax=Nonomuraea sp. NPDC049152 TaxID=3154350 RepID=UPI0033E4AE7A